MSEYVEEIQADGSIARRYSDGTLRTERGHWIAGERPEGSAPLITSDTAHAMIARKQAKTLARREESQGEVERALATALKAKSGAHAAGKMAGKLAQGVMDDRQPLQARTGAFKAVLAAGGMAQERGPTQATQVNITLSAEAAGALRSWGVDLGEIVDAPIDNQPSE